MSRLLAAVLLLCAAAPARAGSIEDEIRQAAGANATPEVLSAIRARLLAELKGMPNKPAPGDPQAVKDYLDNLRRLAEKTAAQMNSGTELEKKSAHAMYGLIRTAIADKRYSAPTPERRETTSPGAGQTQTPPAGAAGPTPGRALPPELQGRERFTEVIADRRPDDPQPQADLGAIRYYQGDVAGAAQRLGRAIELGDRSAGTLTLYGRSAYHQGDMELAAEAARQALKADPSNADAQSLLKLAHGRPSSARVDSALSSVRPMDAAAIGALEEAARGPEAPRMGESTLDYTRRAELAAAAARQAVTPPDRIQQSAAMTREAERSLHIGDYEGARVKASAAIELNRSNAQAWNFRAMAAGRRGDLSDAIYDSSFAITLDQNQAAPYATRSWAFASKKLYAEAERDARRAVELAPGRSQPLLMLAGALDGLGRRPEALDALRSAVAVDARLEPVLAKALQLGADQDMSFLFGGAAAAPAPPVPAARGRRFARLAALSLSGGVLVALGLLQIFSTGWREKVNATLRRTLSGGPAPAAARSPASGFWAQYELVKEIGSGGMGVVYEARDRALDRRVAVKRMRDELKRDPRERQRFVQEAKTVARLRHPNIVEIYAIVEDGEDVYLVFEHVQGRTLAERLADGPMTLIETRRLAAGAGAAIDYAHAQGVVHRDIKPSNIMLSADGTVKVMDFGVARQAKDALTKASLTNTVVGTPPYMAPEQEQGTVRRESDVFALGVVVYESLCCRLPFTGAGAGMLLNKINGRHEPLSRSGGPAVPGLDAVLGKALAADPEARYHRAAEFSEALERLALAAA